MKIRRDEAYGSDWFKLFKNQFIKKSNLTNFPKNLGKYKYSMDWDILFTEDGEYKKRKHVYSSNSIQCEI